MRSIWKGAITFGLVNVPVKVYSATEDHDISLHQVHDKDGGRIRYERHCEICGEKVDYEHIDKAFDDGDQTVVLTGDDLKSLPQERSREIDVIEFVPSDQLDPIMFDRSYFLEPDGTSPKAYVLLRRALEETERTAIVHFSLRQKTRLGALRVRGDVLMLQSLLWDDEVREAKFPALEKAPKISDRELDMSASLVDSLENDFDASKFTDDYQKELRQLIDAKLKEGDAVDTDATFGRSPDDDEDGEGGEVIDLMEALRQSVEKNRNAKKDAGGSSSTRTTAPKKPAPKKPAAKKPAASKPAASKPAASKPAASKPAASKPAASKPAAKEPAAAKQAAQATSGEKKRAS